MGRHALIPVSPETHKQLAQMKLDMNLKTFDDVILELIKYDETNTKEVRA